MGTPQSNASDVSAEVSLANSLVTIPPAQSTPNTSSLSLLELKQNSTIWYKIHVLLYDLRHFEQSLVSQCRLETVVDPSYLGEPYFNPDEAEKVKYARLDGVDKTISGLIEETLRERLQRRIKKRVEIGDYRVCAGHDVAPILEKTFGIKPKDLERCKAFQDKMAAKGLHLDPGEQWTGLGQQRKTVHNNNGKRKGKR